MGVVHPEDRHPVLDPGAHNLQDRLVDALGVVVEVERVDVLVLLGRVLGVGDGAVSQDREPLGVLGHPRVVRGALERQVQGHLHAQLARARHQGVEVLEGAQVGVDGVVAAVGGADAVGGAGVAGTRRQGVVAPLAVGQADGGDGREVEDVEAHGRDAVQPLGRAAQRPRVPGAVLTGSRAQRAREDLIPGTGQGALAVHLEGVLGGGRDVVAQRQALQGGLDRVRQARSQAVGHGVGGVAHDPHGVVEGLDALLVAPLNGHRSVQDPGALLQHELDVDAGGHLDAGVVAPGGVRVRPALDAEAPVPGGVGRQGGLVAVQPRGDVVHAGARAVAAVRTHQDRGGAVAVVPLAEDGGADRNDLADDGLGRPAPVLDDGEDLGDRDPADQRERGRLRCRAGRGRPRRRGLRPGALSGCVGGSGRGLGGTGGLLLAGLRRRVRSHRSKTTVRNDLSHMPARRTRIGPVRALRTGPIEGVGGPAQRPAGPQ